MVEQFPSIDANGISIPQAAPQTSVGAVKTTDGRDFKSLLSESINKVNQLQAEADKARIDLATGRTDNVAEVFTAIKKAELAFHTLMQIRNKLMDAYEEIKQMRV